MSTTTIKSAGYEDNVNPNSYLDANTNAVLFPAGLDGISGWIFDVPKNETVTLESDMTEHYIESGGFITDHIVHKPAQVTLSGLIGELVYRAPEKGSAEAVLASLESSMTAVDAYAPELRGQALQGVNAALQTAAYAASQFEALKKRYQNLKSLFQGEGFQRTLQAQAFLDITAMRNSKQIVTVQTPWGYYRGMVIVSITSRQDEGSTEYTDFSVTLKEARFANVEVTEFDYNSYKSEMELQKAAETDAGEVAGKKHDVSFIKSAYNAAGK